MYKLNKIFLKKSQPMGGKKSCPHSVSIVAFLYD